MKARSNKNASFDADCTDCPRIATNLQAVKKEFPSYHCRPVAPFGDAHPSLLIVGLGPGMHGANATGRPFTGDHAGILLYKMLHRFHFSNHPESHDSNDGLVLTNCRITNAVKCLPPANKPQPDEIIRCNRYLRAELEHIKNKLVILALGKIAHDAVLRALDLKLSSHVFAHHAIHTLDNQRTLLDSYHCSRYNTQTRRLTEPMFSDIFSTAVGLMHAKV